MIARIEKDGQTSFFLPCALPHAPEDILQEEGADFQLVDRDTSDQTWRRMGRCSYPKKLSTHTCCSSAQLAQF